MIFLSSPVDELPRERGLFGYTAVTQTSKGFCLEGPCLVKLPFHRKFLVTLTKMPVFCGSFFADGRSASVPLKNKPSQSS